MADVTKSEVAVVSVLMGYIAAKVFPALAGKLVPKRKAKAKGRIYVPPRSGSGPR